MKRVPTNLALFILAPVMLALMAFFVAPASALPARPITASSGGLFMSSFEGVLSGARGSRASATLELVQDGRAVTGEITVGRGLLIDAGNCGIIEIPPAAQAATGNTTARAPRQLTATIDFNVDGIPVTVNLEGELSRDGEDLAATAEIDLPWLCGRDPVVTGAFARAK